MKYAEVKTKLFMDFIKHINYFELLGGITTPEPELYTYWVNAPGGPIYFGIGLDLITEGGSSTLWCEDSDESWTKKCGVRDVQDVDFWVQINAEKGHLVAYLIHPNNLRRLISASKTIKFLPEQRLSYKAIEREDIEKISLTRIDLGKSQLKDFSQLSGQDRG